MTHPGDSARTDEEIFQAWVAGEESAFEAIFNKYSEMLRVFLSGRFRLTDDLVDDAVQASFIRLFEKHEHFDSRRRLRPWLFTLAANTAANMLSSVKSRPAVRFSEMTSHASGREGQPTLYDPADDDAIEGSRESLINERAEQVTAAVQRLPAGDREAVEAVFFRGLEYAEAADELGIPVGSLKTRIHRSLRTMRCHLDFNGAMTEAA